MDETLSVRIPVKQVRDLQEVAELAKLSRSDLLREVLRKGIQRKRIELAIQAYRGGEASFGRCREIADVPIHQLLDEFLRAGVVRNYDLEDLREDLAWARRS